MNVASTPALINRGLGWMDTTHLEEADLFMAHLEGADLSGAHLEGAKLSWAHLEGAKGLTQDQLESAVGDTETTLPVGLTRPAHWTKEEQGRAESRP